MTSIENEPVRTERETTGKVSKMFRRWHLIKCEEKEREREQAEEKSESTSDEKTFID
jgi:hypothetical protein